MTFNREQEQVAYKRLPPDIQDFVMSNDTADFVTNALKEAGLSEDQVTLGDSQIFYALLGLQTLDTTIKNISESSQKPEEGFSKLKLDLQENIFKKIEAFGIKQTDFVEASQIKLEEQAASLPKLAPNILPEIVLGQRAREIPHVDLILTSVPTISPGIPQILIPILQKTVTKNENGRPNLEFPQSSYPQGKDPYREPLE